MTHDSVFSDTVLAMNAEAADPEARRDGRVVYPEYRFRIVRSVVCFVSRRFDRNISGSSEAAVGCVPGCVPSVRACAAQGNTINPKTRYIYFRYADMQGDGPCEKSDSDLHSMQHEVHRRAAPNPEIPFHIAHVNFPHEPTKLVSFVRESVKLNP